jgi:hypothetical protein
MLSTTYTIGEIMSKNQHFSNIVGPFTNIVGIHEYLLAYIDDYHLWSKGFGREVAMVAFDLSD